MAVLELRVVLAMILERFTIRISPSSKVAPLPAVTLRPQELRVSLVANNKRDHVYFWPSIILFLR
jgi:hypothetical protein